MLGLLAEGEDLELEDSLGCIVLEEREGGREGGIDGEGSKREIHVSPHSTMFHSSVVFRHHFCSHDGIPAHFFLLCCPSGPELPFSPTLCLPRLSPMWSVTPFPSNCCHMYFSSLCVL